VGNKSKNWIDGTGVHEISELTTSPDPALPIGTQYRKFTTAGTTTMKVNLDEYANNGYADYWALVSGTWYHRQGLVDAPLTELAYASGVITYTGANINDGFALLKVTQGVQV